MTTTERRNQRKPFSSVPPPPRTLNVTKFTESRAPELNSLHFVVSNRLNNDFKSQRSKRRRTTGFDNRSNGKRFYRKRKKISAEEDSYKEVLLPRKIRRRIELRKNPESGFSISGDGTKRLGTHLWHAKRFTMAKKWGYYVPLGLPGRGRGSRAILKRFRHGVLLHDASYNSAVQLEGPEDSLLSVLRMVLVPTPSPHLEEVSTSTLSGATSGSAMLHHVGAPFSQLISPVTYMWRPFIRKNVVTETGSGHIESESSSSQSRSWCSSFRQLWVWIHAGSLDEGLGALRLACQKQRDKTTIPVNCVSLEGQLANLEVMGSKSIQIIQKILCPLFGTTGSSLELMISSGDEARHCPQYQRPFILENIAHLPDNAILSLDVKDPRDLPKKGSKGLSEAVSNSFEGDVVKDESNEYFASTTYSEQNKTIISSLWLNSEANSVLYSDTKDLWENRNGVNPPLDENLLCLKKHQKRIEFFHLDKNSGMSSNEISEQSSRSCPVLLLKKSDLLGPCDRWNIILPLSWVKALWLPLVNRGAHAVGLRERHWIACDVGLASFPFDFPDCKAYSCFMAAEAVASDEKLELRPLAMRPLRVPIPTPWDSVRLAFEIKPPNEEDTQDVHKEDSKRERNDCGSLGDGRNIAYCKSDLLEQDDCPFKGFVARTSSILSSHLKDIHGGHLLLFPKEQPGTKANLMENRDKIIPVPGGDNCLPLDQKLCFLRVLLCAYKEGSFEEGSVICAPHLADILLWKSGSDAEEGRLQMPQSLVGPYYKQQDCGKWELQKPEDPLTRGSHRWPVGFVTTGFVRGSKKPLAEAFCEATLLARLRSQQWEGKQGKQKKSEIFVLVRNLRSTAYRLALATIVLEHQSEDVEFM